MDPKQAQAIQDSLNSLHKRMDNYYAWAAQLQVEIRNIQKRQTFLESQAKVDIPLIEEAQLQARLEKIKKL